MSHHPLEELKEFDRKAIRPIVDRSFDILLCGHVHSSDASFIQGFFGNIFIATSASTMAISFIDRTNHIGYQVIDFWKGERIQVEYRKYDQRHNKFVLDTESGNTEGYLKITCPTTQDIQHAHSVRDIIDTLLDVRVDSLNEHLIIYGTDTKAPCRVEDVFVEPRLTNIPESQLLEEEDVKEYTLLELLESENRFLVFGQKESGKTILLDEMFIQALKRYPKLQTIPVLIKFPEIGNADLTTIVRTFLSVKVNDIKSILKTDKVLLLIDDIRFSDDYKHQLSKLQTFIQEYPSVRIIATCEWFGEGTIPTEYLSYNKDYRFDIAFIQPLASRHIKSLIGNWFYRQEIDYSEKIEKLIKVFFTLSLPRTPLAVSLFLWIIEKQEKKPINNSTLVELFIENLLEKANFENIYSETFDFKNKQRLLAFISKYMLENGDALNNYRIKYSDCLDYTYEYLKNKVDVDARRLIDNFVQRGILIVVENQFLCFKFSFFFHYFLAKLMEYDSSFKEFVLKDNNFLSFIDEIDYYTGLKRDDEQMLKFSQDRLIEAFQEVNSYLRNEEVDKFFESRDLLSSSISLDKVKHKPTEKEYEKMYDEQLSHLPVKKGIEKKDFSRNPKAYDRILKLACAILKNSEDVDNHQLRKEAYNNTIISSISFLVISKMYLIDYVKKFNKIPDHFPSNVDFNLFVRVLPLIHQILLFDWMGSSKLIPIIRQNLIPGKSKSGTYELERFFSVFIYSDLRGRNYQDEIKKYVKTIGPRYIKDISFVKVLSYYYFRSKDPQTDKVLLKILADLKKRTRQLSGPRISEFINNLRGKKKETLKEEGEKQNE